MAIMRDDEVLARDDVGFFPAAPNYQVLDHLEEGPR